MVSAAHAGETGDLVIRPRLGTGWQTTADGARQEVRLRYMLLGVLLPVVRRVPFSRVARLGVVARESWWSRAGMWPGGDSALVPFGFTSRAEMPGKGWRYDIEMTEKGGGTTRLVTLTPSQDAHAVAAQLRHRVGLPPVE